MPAWRRDRRLVELNVRASSRPPPGALRCEPAALRVQI